MIKGFLSLYRPGYLVTLDYMLQNTEYQVFPYLKWYWRTKNYRSVMVRRTLQPTKAARILLLALRIATGLQIAIGLVLIYRGIWQNMVGGVSFGAAILVATPVVTAHIVVVAIFLGRLFIVMPEEKRSIEQSEKIFAAYKGIKIAVAGSYGKTTMKELLSTVLSEGLNVAATPANKNVSISHAAYAKNLTGKEDALIIEYGEGAPGDVQKFSHITQPTHAVITGLAPAHLDRYKTLHAAGEDIFAVADYLTGKNVYVNSEAPSVKPFLKKSYQLFDEHGTLGWKTGNIMVDLSGTKFTMKNKNKVLKLHSGLIGRHQVGYLAFAAAFGLELGLSQSQVQAGIAKTKPFEHRMKPYQLAGAWVIDDTYNGNLEGIRAGTQLLSELKAERKIYVTPGLVDQGQETDAIHKEVGELIAKAKPDIVVVMKNSVTDYIQRGLEKAKYAGELRIETDPLDFYNNLTHFVANGDLVLMQNDWPDNYA